MVLVGHVGSGSVRASSWVRGLETSTEEIEGVVVVSVPGCAEVGIVELAVRDVRSCDVESEHL